MIRILYDADRVINVIKTDPASKTYSQYRQKDFATPEDAAKFISEQKLECDSKFNLPAVPKLPKFKTIKKERNSDEKHAEIPIVDFVDLSELDFTPDAE